MAFGFPAYHSTTLDLSSQPLEKVLAIVAKAMQAQGWKINLQHGNTLQATSSISWLSWAETISAQLDDNHILQLKSKCSMPTQCLDWGKNRRNIEKLVAEIHKNLAI